LKHVTAACVAGGNPEKLIQIPNIDGLDKNEVVSPRSSRSVYDHAVRNVGVKMITVDTAEELESALGPRTAMIYLTAGGPSVSGPLSLENVSKLAKPRNIPILVDAAAENLTIPNIHLQRGADIVAYSGGKRFADRNARGCCWVARICSCRHGKPALRITGPDATTRSAARKLWACWPQSRCG
jgi:seryl-tRNA(Sec) selenium transferase